MHGKSLEPSDQAMERACDTLGKWINIALVIVGTCLVAVAFTLYENGAFDVILDWIKTYGGDMKFFN